MTIDTEVYKQLGAHGAEIKAVNTQLTELKDRMQAVEEKQDLILAKLNSVGGGWRAMVGMGLVVTSLITLAYQGIEIIRAILHIKA
jgi:hypothetical protein